MEELLTNLKVFDRIRREGKVSLFLDYDGTLTPIALRPDLALLSSEMKEVLRDLMLMHKYQLTVISGRDIDDVRRMVGLENINYVGNHGYEVLLPGLEINRLSSPQYDDVVGTLKKSIHQEIDSISGAFIEDKGVTISVHYRMVEESSEADLKNTLTELIEPFVIKGDVRLYEGKKVLEVRPPLDWDKGKAMQWILKQQGGFPVYLGDDKTDEDAFRVIDEGISVFVGEEGRELSYAKYYLKNTMGVYHFLVKLKEIR